jgi:hypothetical protein
MCLDGVLDRQGMQVEDLCHLVQLGLVGLVQPHPDEVVGATAIAHGRQVGDLAVDRDPHAVAVQGVVDNHGGRLSPLESPAWQP